MCSNDQHLKSQIRHLKKVFKNINGYPNWVIEQTIEKVKKTKRNGTINSDMN